MFATHKVPIMHTLLEILSETGETDNMPDNINFEQWMPTTKRAEMVTITMSKEEFLEILVDKLSNLKQHHYISKIQSAFIKDKKANLNVAECLVLAGFQKILVSLYKMKFKATTGQKKQATLHPFVYYYI